LRKQGHEPIAAGFGRAFDFNDVLAVAATDNKIGVTRRRSWQGHDFPATSAERLYYRSLNR
jgi:hypothetical protein